VSERAIYSADFAGATSDLLLRAFPGLVVAFLVRFTGSRLAATFLTAGLGVAFLAAFFRAAHLFRCASAIRFRPAADGPDLFFDGVDLAAFLVADPGGLPRRFCGESEERRPRALWSRAISWSIPAIKSEIFIPVNIYRRGCIPLANWQKV